MGKAKNKQAGPAAGGQAPVVEQTKKQKQAQQKQLQQQPQQQRSAGGPAHYTSFIQVLPLDIDHTCPSVLLFFDKERYLFNAGEGIQRLFREHRLKIKKVDAYFVTRISTETLAGLPGMALSVNCLDAGGLLERQASCVVKGPRGLSRFVAAFRPYINAENTVAVEEFDADVSEPILKTEVVSITPIVVRMGAAAGGSAPPSPARGAADGEAGGAEGGAVEAQGGGSPAAKRRRTEAANGEDTTGPAGRARPCPLSPLPDTVVYLAQLAGRPGKFDIAKAKAAGVRPGPLYGELQRGKAVPNEAGRLVQPDEVMEPGVPGPCVLLAEAAHPDCLAALAADERVRRAAEAAAADPARLCVAVHCLSPAAAAAGPALAAWQAALGPRWRHLVVTPGPHQPSALPRASTFQAKLHALQPTAFPLFALDNAVAPPRPPPVPEEVGAAMAATAAAAAAAQAAALKAAAERKGGKSAAGGGAAAAAPAAPAAAAMTVAQLPPVHPVEAGSVTETMSAVRFNLMPPARQGLEYGDVFEYDSAEAAMAEVRASEACAPALAAAAELRGEPPPAGAAGGAGGATAEEAAGPAREERAMREASDPPAGGVAEAGDVEEDAVATPAAQEAGAQGGGADGSPSPAPPSPSREGAGAAEAGPRDIEMPAVVASGDRTVFELTLLGTASSQPSKYRNVSGCYVDLFDRGGLLVDCGEDAMGQMKRSYGPAGAEARLAALRACWVSHMHADHHGGLYRLLEWRARRGCGPLLVLGPGKLFDALVRYSAAVPIQFTFLSNAALSGALRAPPPPPAVRQAYEEVVQALGLTRLMPYGVEHVYDSHGLVLEGRAPGGEPWKVVFSADTRPCQQTVTAARGATLLVHEATFEAGMQGEARAKRHSTTAEAIEMGERSGAYRTLLTHFSTRYPTLPEGLDEAPHPRVAVAMDLMRVNAADLAWLPRLVRPMGLLFRALELEKEQDDD